MKNEHNMTTRKEVKSITKNFVGVKNFIFRRDNKFSNTLDPEVPVGYISHPADEIVSAKVSF